MKPQKQKTLKEVRKSIREYISNLKQSYSQADGTITDTSVQHDIDCMKRALELLK